MSDIDCILYGLMIACPLEEHKAECPIAEFREWPIKRRIQHLKGLESSERKLLYCQHKDCLNEQELNYFSKLKLMRKSNKLS